jgi:CheY-like chemotaxis protein
MRMTSGDDHDDVSRARAELGALAAAERRLEATLNILVAEDDDDTAEPMAEIATSGGHSVRVVSDGAAVLQLLGEFLPDLLLLDLGLPRLDGIEVARRIRAQLGPGMRIVAVTGYADPKHVELARAAGCDDVLLKPFRREALESLIMTVADRFVLARRTAR